MNKRKLYHNGDVFEGERFIMKIDDPIQLDWLLAKTPVARKKYLDFPDLIESHCSKETGSNKDLKEFIEELGVPPIEKEDHNLGQMLRDTCNHQFVFVEKTGLDYIFACRRCLYLVTRNINDVVKYHNNNN